MTQILRYRLSAQNSYIVGKQVVIKFTLENLSGREIWVLKWYTPLEGLKGRILKIFCESKEILYEGRMIKRSDPGTEDYVHLSPRGSVSADVDISSAYALPVCSEVKVSFIGNIQDVVFSGEPLPRKSEDQRSLDISGNPILFSIMPSK
jgi:hypothetical protein